jgi:SAM-dependent methyltransferase
MPFFCPRTLANLDLITRQDFSVRSSSSLLLNPLRLAELNSLVATQSGVWALRGESGSFEYSDGDAEEENLESILTNATNLDSLSVELEEKYNDWASEYHFSPRRANLLRYLDLTHKKTALELGCGCGALTRYLGEQGLAVDAVEGSQRRANLARIRCQGLQNVDVITCNFFDLTFPTNHYDAIFFVGVMEYAGRFSPTDPSAETSVVRLLEKVRPCLTPQGVIVIAIENRVGKKYLCGAGEDHYGSAFEGIHGYPNYSGIKTWSQDEWRVNLHDVGLTYAFHYPFPDYKLPSLVLSDHYLSSDPNAWVRLTGISSRDYHGLIPPQDDLPFWQSVHQAGCLGAFSNSFLIVAGMDKEQVNRVTPFDFVQTSNPARYPQFRTQTRRYRNSDVVEKVYLHNPISEYDSPLRHALDAEPWRHGIPLSNLWIQLLRIDPSHERFVQLSIEYFEFLKSHYDEAPDAGVLLDVLPMNIMVAPTGEWHSFDHEWTTAAPIDTAFIFFRGLFYFCQAAQEVLRVVYRNQPAWTLQECLDSCLLAVGLDLESNLDKFIIWEESFQNTVIQNRKGVSTRDFLRLRLSAPRQTVQIFWARSTEEFTEFQSQTNYISIGDDLQSLSFTLPKNVYPPIELRIDPGVEKGVFDIRRIRVEWFKNNLSTRLQVLHPSVSSDTKLLTFQNIRPHPTDHEQLFCAVTQDPNISWQLPRNSSCHAGGCIRIEMMLKWLNNEPDNFLSTPGSRNRLDSYSPKRRFPFRKSDFLAALAERWRSSKNSL